MDNSRFLSHQLVGHVSMVPACHAVTNGRLHQTGEGGQDVDGWVDLPVVQLSVHVDLSLGDVASEIGNGVGDVCVVETSQQYIIYTPKKAMQYSNTVQIFIPPPLSFQKFNPPKKERKKKRMK